MAFPVTSRFLTAGVLCALAFVLPQSAAAHGHSAWREIVLHTFQGATDGNSPFAGLVSDQFGVLYGTTKYGGNLGCSSGYGCGTVYKLVPSGKRYVASVVYAFAGGADGAYPLSTLTVDATGTIYGTTSTGGTGTNCLGGCGTVFKLSPYGSGYVKGTVYSFAGGANDGASPQSGVTLDQTGALYGTTFAGGGGACRLGCGTVYALRLASSTYTEQILHRFRGTDGANPTGGVIVDATGSLYGTATTGGRHTCVASPAPIGCGVAFNIAHMKEHYRYGVLYDFQGGSDGWAPQAALLMDQTGSLYGTTLNGGAACGCGTVFALTFSSSGYTKSTLYAFQGSGDGAFPVAGLTAGLNGVLYGTTLYGGHNACLYKPGCGTVFALTPGSSGYTESILLALHGLGEGAWPYGGVIADQSGSLYGALLDAGDPTCYCGAAFKLMPSTNEQRVSSNRFQRF